jgi:hypothetical protein
MLSFRIHLNAREKLSHLPQMHVIVHILLEVPKLFATLPYEPHQPLLQPFLVDPINHGLSGFMFYLNKPMCL